MGVNNNIFGCLKCGMTIHTYDAYWKCSSCGNIWQLDEYGIALMSEDNYFFGANQEAMNNMLTEINMMSFEKLVENSERLENKYKDFNYNYCLNPARADWTYLGDFNEKTVLDLACGYGSISIPLSKRAKYIIAIDGTYERIKFLSIIKRMKSIDNIIPIHGNVTKIPIKPNSMDDIIMVGLLEYAGYFYKDGSPKSLQIKYLKYLHQMLSDNGVLWVGIENRLSPEHFLGYTHHGDLPYTPLLPGWISNIVTRIVKSQPYRLRLHTEWGYYSLLKKAGFSKVEILYPFYDYKLPNFIASSRNNQLISKYIENTILDVKLKKRIALSLIKYLDKFNLVGIFAPAFFIKASR